MKVLLLNGSPNEAGCTFTALKEIAQTLAVFHIDSEILQLGKQPNRDCIGCGACGSRNGVCVFEDDAVNELIGKAAEADGFVFGSPVYYAHANGRVLSVLDRAFYAGGSAFTHTPGAAVVSARRAGTTAALDDLNKYFMINQMPVVSSTYWNMVHGNTPEEVAQDLEGLQTMRNIASNMAWLLKCIEAGKEKGIEAPVNSKVATNFIR